MRFSSCGWLEASAHQGSGVADLHVQPSLDCIVVELECGTVAGLQSKVRSWFSGKRLDATHRPATVHALSEEQWGEQIATATRIHDIAAAPRVGRPPKRARELGLVGGAGGAGDAARGASSDFLGDSRDYLGASRRLWEIPRVPLLAPGPIFLRV